MDLYKEFKTHLFGTNLACIIIMCIKNVIIKASLVYDLLISVSTNCGEFVGRCSMMQQQVDDVCVSLLCSLMERCVTVLHRRQNELENISAASNTHKSCFISSP